MFNRRTSRTLETDRAQEKLIDQKRRTHSILSLVMFVVVAIAYYLGVPSVLIIAGIAGWLGMILHSQHLSVINELIEINDQLAGRKDEFQTLIHKPDTNNQSAIPE